MSLSADDTEGVPCETRTRKHGRRGEHRVTLFGVRFDGVGTVTDPEALGTSLRTGIGPAKGFGFGLLSLAPA